MTLAAGAAAAALASAGLFTMPGAEASDAGAVVATANAAVVGAPDSPWSSAATMAEARSFSTATLLEDGKVLVAAGYGGGDYPLGSAELYDPGTDSWSSAGAMAQGRYSHTATLLEDGKVLVAGGQWGGRSAELYDPVTDSWSSAGAMAQSRSDHTATLLTDGQVLVTGGQGGFGAGSAELYHPGTNSWSSAGAMSDERVYHTAILLNTGKVLVAGGYSVSAGDLNSAELYDPVTGSWSSAGNMTEARFDAASALLPDGKVLIAGGANEFGADFSSAELYDPATNSWTSAGSMTHTRSAHTASALADGKVLAAGGCACGGGVADFRRSAEVYNPATNSWSSGGTMAQARFNHPATLLPDGRVLVAGGSQDFSTSSGILSTAEIYDPSWSPRHVLSVTASGSGSGTVVSAPAGIDCGDTCTASFDSGTSVTLTADPDGTSEFTGWSGAGCTGSGDCTVTMDQARTVAATFSTTCDATVAVAVTDYAFTPRAPIVSQGECVTWSFDQGTHSATDTRQLGDSSAPLFDSGTKSSGTYSYKFEAAGRYPYRPTTAGDPSTMSGAIRVPLRTSTLSGTASTPITVTWSSQQLPGYRFDIQYRYRAPGGAYGSWTGWKTDQTDTSDTFTADTLNGAGKYKLRGHLENATTLNASAWSPAKRITIS